MSIIFGICKPLGDSTTRQEVVHFSAATERYAAEGTEIAVSGRTGMGMQHYRTHERASLETGPAVDETGNMIALDGRIDNHKELREQLGLSDPRTPDSLIVLAAFRRWGNACFSHLIGDWALAIWSAAEQTLYLARDHAGTRSLYFRNLDGVLQWSTYLETLVGAATAPVIDDEYVVRYLSSRPLRDITPYKHIRSVPPAHSLAIRDERVSTRCHWDPAAPRRIRYASDQEYDEHFLALFQQAVARRTGTGAPILAHLSGGMDSTSIVCMSDHLRRQQGQTTEELLDTLSFYDDTEANWDERSYFSLVERSRGKTGVHIRTSLLDRTCLPEDPSNGVSLLPGRDSASAQHESHLMQAISARPYKVILAGMGGDEVLGGVPAPDPELATLLMSGHFVKFISRSIAWCLPSRSPLIRTIGGVLASTIQLYRGEPINSNSIPTWIHKELLARSSMCDKDYSAIRNRHRATPLAICNGSAWWAVMETLPHLRPSILTRHEYRYPYLDRDLVEFLFAIPREQLIQPGRRRYLMRRALQGIVPREILERRRKAFISRAPLLALKDANASIQKLFANSLAAERSWIDVEAFSSVLSGTVETNDPRWVMPLATTVAFELWLQSALRRLVPDASAQPRKITLATELSGQDPRWARSPA